MLGTLKGNESRREDQLDLQSSARAETANNVCERLFTNEPGFKFHRHLYSFETGDLLLFDWPKQCDLKLSAMSKRPLMIVRPLSLSQAVCCEIKSVNEQRKFRKVFDVQHHRAYYKRNTLKLQV
ncbi:hypothetical protein AVEN_109797-1 [Araneus ventricosus]|uniref:Uncharacterized protein n=1 Tax=Araneus ventricosus TaxID=182803 RepID=A0A4Y2KHP3_ARAVE|nr:hypothetical protein AVEN_109797-1 [Araneus ventricosus]